MSFILGCSFSFEWALLEDGLRLRHQDQGMNVPMYRTSMQTVAAGRFHGPMVVSMRPYRPSDAIRAIQITSRAAGVAVSGLTLANDGDTLVTPYSGSERCPLLLSNCRRN